MLIPLPRPIRVLPALCLAGLLALTGCLDSGEHQAPPAAVGSATLGPAGGQVDGPDGVRLAVPADALPGDVTFRIARDDAGAPPLDGLMPLSPVYAVTPHGQPFAGTASLSIPLPEGGVPASATPVLLKADPGGAWRVMPNTSTDPTRLATDLDGLSFFVLGTCSATQTDFWTIGAPGCPANHVLRLVILDDATGAPIQAFRGPNGVGIPLWFATDTVQTRRFTVSWTRPAGVDRPDGIAVVGNPGGFSNPRGFTSTWGSPAVREVNGNLSSSFTVTIDPSKVPGASSPGGALLRVKATASYSTTAFRIGQGDVPVGFAFEADVPILVTYSGSAPTIGTPPASQGLLEGQPATFGVSAGVSPAAPLSYQWFRQSAGASDFSPIAGATASSYTLGAVALLDDGAQFQVEVCVAGTTRCVTSAPATLSVTGGAVLPTFTAQPAPVSIAAGQTASLTATASGVPTPALRWQVGGPGSGAFVDVSTGSCAPKPPPASGSVNTATCTLGPLAAPDDGIRVRAVATNAASTTGVTSNEATITVTPAPAAPAITTPPAPQSAATAGSATFSVAATGTAPLSYAWSINGTALTSAGSFSAGTCSGTASFTGGSVTLSGLSAGCDGASVVVVVNNGIAPAATSQPAALTITPATATLSLLVGAIGGAGSLDGTGADARVSLDFGSGIAFDASGNAYFCDPRAGWLRRVTPAGVVSTVFTGLVRPQGVAVDSAGNIYVAEQGRHRILRINPEGVDAVFVGSTQGDLDGTGTAAQLSNPQSLAIDASGNLYVAEAGSTIKIRRISPAAVVSTVYTFAGAFNGVQGIAVTPDGGAVFGAGTGPDWGHTIVRIAGGSATVLAGSPGQAGFADASGSAARFNLPVRVVRAANGDLFASDANNRVIRRITPAGQVTTVSGTTTFGLPPADGSGSAGRYAFPSAMGRAPSGDLLIFDAEVLRRLTNTTSTFDLGPLAGRRLATGTTDGTGSGARFRSPGGGIALDGSGNLLVADRAVRRVTPDGVVTTLSATQATHVVRDGTGFVLAGDNVVWRMNAAGDVTLLAGNPNESDYVDAPVGTDARFGSIVGLAVDGAGNVYVGEAVNGNAAIRRITPAGAVSTWAGAKDAPPEVVDGDRLAARFGFLTGGLVFDAAGNLFVADSNLLRRISPAGMVSTFVGAGAGLEPATALAFEPGGGLLAGGAATLQRIGATGAVSSLIGERNVLGVRLGTTPNLNVVFGMAVRPDGRVLLRSEGAVVELVLP